MERTLADLQRLLEYGDNIANLDRRALESGFSSHNEYSRYKNWRRKSGKSISKKNSDFLSDLEWWRERVDYCQACVFKEYAKANGYIVDSKDLKCFSQWRYYNHKTHSNRKEYLDLYIEYLNRLPTEYSVVGDNLSSNDSERQDVIAKYLGFNDRTERRKYDRYCHELGFNYSSDKVRYLEGIEDWKKSQKPAKNSERTLVMSNFFDSKQEYQNFINWRNRWDIPTTNNDEVLSAIKQYKTDACLREKKRNLPWKDGCQIKRYTKYSATHGFSFNKDPERYLAEFQNWSDNIDNGPRV